MCTRWCTLLHAGLFLPYFYISFNICTDLFVNTAWDLIFNHADQLMESIYVTHLHLNLPVVVSALPPSTEDWKHSFGCVFSSSYGVAVKNVWLCRVKSFLKVFLLFILSIFEAKNSPLFADTLTVDVDWNVQIESISKANYNAIEIQLQFENVLGFLRCPKTAKKLYLAYMLTGNDSYWFMLIYIQFSFDLIGFYKVWFWTEPHSAMKAFQLYCSLSKY